MATTIKNQIKPGYKQVEPLRFHNVEYIEKLASMATVLETTFYAQQWQNT